MRRASLTLVLVAFIFSCGGQWALLQGVAWANMIHEYASMVPLSQAVEMTFSGRHPCALCQAIAEKKQSENAKLLALHKQGKQICPARLIARIPAAIVSLHSFPAWARSFQTRTEAPPKPPPRFA